MEHSIGEQWIQQLEHVCVMNKQGLPENKVGEVQERSRLKDMQRQNATHGH